ncbi:anticodon-binding protein [Astrocystis sublimbata]|nr:anticodon-binding protein [Astrocystis sublimbata]
MEHCYWTRPGDDEARGVLSFPPTIAPNKVIIAPLSANEEFRPICYDMSQKLRKLGVANRIDDSAASIGRRYARNDELGTPLGITVDFQTLKDGTVTLRDRDSMKQVRADGEEIVKAVRDVVLGIKSWKEVEGGMPAFLGQDEEVVVREKGGE